MWSRASDQRQTLWKVPVSRSLLRLYFAVKYRVKLFVLSLLKVYSEPSESLREENSWLSSHPPAHFTVDHHSRFQNTTCNKFTLGGFYVSVFSFFKACRGSCCCLFVGALELHIPCVLMKSPPCLLFALNFVIFLSIADHCLSNLDFLFYITFIHQFSTLDFRVRSRFIHQSNQEQRITTKRMTEH